MGTCGKRIIRDILDEIEEQIQEYYGLLNELKMGARSTRPVKPDILVLYETLNTLNLPLVSGSYMDQPYITTEMLIATKNIVTMMEYLQSVNKQGTG